ncbi:MAG: nitronate monooxygenase [Desulfobacteraceae bacterium]|nr:nitronate monooxygenase [Desulfobacteraceae bacterium]
MNIPKLEIGDLTSPLAIVQGGMGVGISMSKLASAVADEGGIGVISAAMTGIEEPDVRENAVQANIRTLKQEIIKAKEATKGVLGVNIMVALTNFADLVKTSIEEKIDIIFSGAGLPLNLPQYLKKGSTTKLVPIVSSARAAGLICKKWLAKFDYLPDAFVVEGPKAGGHLGFKEEQLEDPKFSLENLVREVIDIVKTFEAQVKKKIPVIAAGGIFTGADIHKFIKMGAAGVQLGTRFVATHECDADDGFKQAYVKANKEDLVVIKSPVGMPGRALRNDFIDAVNIGKKKPFRCLYHCIKTCEQKKSPYCIALALARAKKGAFKHGFAFAGENAWRVNKIISVKELMSILQTEFSLAAG